MRFILVILFSLAVGNTFALPLPTFHAKHKNNINVVLSKKININTASVRDMKSLPGMNIGKARSIVRYRKKHGLFKTFDVLRKVSGFKRIKRKKLELILKNFVLQ